MGDSPDNLSDFVPGRGFADFPGGDLAELATFKQPATLRAQGVDGALRLLISGARLHEQLIAVLAFQFQAGGEEFPQRIIELKPDVMKHDAVAADATSRAEAGRDSLSG